METEKIQLQQERDFGQIFNASFAFLQQEIKPFCLCLLIFVVPIILILGIGFELIYSSMSKISQIYSPGQDPGMAFNFLGKFLGQFSIIMILALFAHSSLVITVISYLKIYLKKNDSPTPGEIYKEILKNMFPVILAMIIGWIAIAISFIFCILPSIYMGVSLSLFLIVLIIEEGGIFNAFGRSFQLTHIQWWWTFLILLVSLIMYYSIYTLLEVPAYIYGIKSVIENILQKRNSLMPFNSTYIIYQSIVISISYLIYAIPLLILGFQYFNLVEIRERPSLESKIEEINQNENV